jgi:exonuclease V gamma subunit
LVALKIHWCASLNEAVKHYRKNPRSNPSSASFTANGRVSLFATSGHGSEQWLVNSGATGRWLAHEFARLDGVFAGQPIDFVGSYLWQLIGRAAPTLPSISPFEPTVTVWVIYEWLNQLDSASLQPEGFAAELAPRLGSMLGQERFKFATFIAQLYEQYLIERLDWLAAWQRGDLLGLGSHEAWQAQLWKFLLARLPAVQDKHPFEWLSRASAQTLELPSRIVLFGANQLPLLHWEALTQLALHCEIQVYSFIVCDEFHADLVSQVTQWKLQLRHQNEDTSRYLEVGHPLLASWGYSLAAEQDRMVSTTEKWPQTQLTESAVLGWVEQRQDCVLRQLQCSVATLDRVVMTKLIGDTSLRVFGAMGLARQLSHAQACLLEAFEADSELKPSEVLVLCTDLTSVSQLINGLWDQVPFRCLASNLQSNEWLRCFEMWLSATSRELTINDIEELLNERTIRSVFGLSDQDALDFLSALQVAGARHLREEDAKKFSVQAAVERLLLGVAVEPVTQLLSYHVQSRLQEEGEADWNRWAVSHITEDTLAGFSKGLHFLDTLEAYRKRSSRSKPLNDWLSEIRDLVRLLTVSFSSPGYSREFAIQSEGQSQIRASLDRLEQHASQSQIVVQIDAPTVKSALFAHLKVSGTALNPSGSVLVTDASDFFPAEFKRILWIGCDDGVWPRAQAWHRLDLMSAAPRRTDLNCRTEDRANFLKSLMLAQESFWVFYTAREQRSGSVLNPSPLVIELMQVVQGLTVEHVGLLSPNWIAGVSKFSERIDDFAWWSATNTNQTESLVSVNQDSLKQFISHPSRFWAQKIMQMRALWENELNESQLPWSVSKKELRRILTEQRQFANLADHPALPLGAIGNVQQKELEQYQHEFELVSANWQLKCIEQGWEFFITDAWYLRSIIPAIFSWINDGKPRLIYCHESKSLRLLGEDPNHVNCLRELEDLLAAHIKVPQPVFSRSFAAWIGIPSGNDGSVSVPAAYGERQSSSSDAGFLRLTDVDDRWNQLVWRGQMPAQEIVIELLDKKLASWKGLLRKPDSLAKGQETKDS